MDGYQQWPGHPCPRDDETFSSWFARVAHANGLPPKELFRIVLPGGYLHSRDLDRQACKTTIDTMARHTSILPGRLRRLTFAVWAGRLIEEDDGIHKLLWLPPVGREASKKSFGLQLCPLCAAEPIPYYRMSWRLGFVTACSKHGVMLLDRCPECGAPISPISGWNRNTGQIRCWKCERLFADDVAELVDPDDLAIQQALLDAVQTGWMELGEYGPVHSLAAFKILMLVFRLLATGKFATPLRLFVSGRYDLATANYAAIPRIKEVEHLNPASRQLLLRLVWALTRDWPTRFVDACRTVGISQSKIVHGTEMPFALWHPVTTYLSDPVRVLSDEEMLAAQSCLLHQNIHPDRNALVALTGNKIRSKPDICQPANGHAAYGTGRYWKIDGVSPQVKDAVKVAARRAGMGVGLWLEETLRKQLNLLN